MASDNLPSDEEEDIGGIPKFKDNFKLGKWHDFIDEDDDSNYYQALYRNGELFEDTMKNYTIDKLFGGHDESYRDIPAYTRIICDTNPESKAYSAYVETESIPRQLLFSTVFISLAAMWKGFLAGCRPLIGVDGTHLKGNYGGVLLSAMALDANSEIFHLAYAVVSVEDKDNWSYFLWNIYNIVKESSRKDWTIISDRQKVCSPYLSCL